MGTRSSALHMIMIYSAIMYTRTPCNAGGAKRIETEEKKEGKGKGKEYIDVERMDCNIDV